MGSGHLAKPLLGKTFLDRLVNEPVLRIGSKTFSRDDVVMKLKIGDFKAMSILNAYCKQNKITSIAQLFKETSPYELAGTQGIGLTTFCAFLNLLLAEGYTKSDIAKWYRCAPNGNGAARVSFTSVQRRVDAAGTREAAFLAQKKEHQKAEARTRRAASRHIDRTRRAKHEAAVDTFPSS